jgi:multiple sugar transport system ATP-binding protein
MAKIELKSVSKSYGSVEVIENIDLTIDSQEFVVFVGPSGCGKSTLLRMICGLESITSGALLIDGEDMTAVDPSKRGLAMVFQSYALYPHMTVKENIGFSLKVARRPKEEVAQRIGRAAEILQLTPYLDRYPRELSGGQRQRVAIGRAIVREPKAFLFDEPLSNLDAALRGDMRLQIAELHRNLDSTTIYVTHDQTEAMTLADRIVVLRGGSIEQVGTPYELYETPANEFVAQFIGNPRINMLPCMAEADTVAPITSGAAQFRHDFGRPFRKIGVRPEHIAIQNLADGDKADAYHSVGRLHDIEYFGSDTVAFFDCGFEKMVSARLPGQARLDLGRDYGLTFDLAHVTAFDENGRGMRHQTADGAAA